MSVIKSNNVSTFGYPNLRGFGVLIKMSQEPVIRPVLNLDESTWGGWINSFVLWTATNPWQFLSNVLLCLSPFFFISLILSWKLSKALEAEQKEKKIKAKRSAQISRARKERKQ